MLNKLLLCPLSALFVLLLLSGCITTEVEIALNPDGSGTLMYIQHYDRATEEQRTELRERYQSPDVSRSITRDSILEHYPEPHFRLIRFDDDEPSLRTEVELYFNDINALLIPRPRTINLGLDSLNFSVTNNALMFSLERDGSVGKQMAAYEGPPGRESLSIKNAATGDKITFARELEPDTPATNWVARLAMPGHSIRRTPNLQIFQSYPVIEAETCEIESADWRLTHFLKSNGLDLKLRISLPPEYNTIIRWEKPVVLSGGYVPDHSRSTTELQGGGEFKNGELEIKFPIPEHPVETLSNTVIRIQALRAISPRRVVLGKLAPNTEYQTGELTLKTDDLNNGVGYRAKGPVDLIKSTYILSKRQNRFELDRSSWSGSGTGKTIEHWKFLPVEGCTLELEIHDKLEPFYIDIRIPDIDLSQRAWKMNENPAAEKAAADWKAQLEETHPELLSVEVPPVTASVFESGATFKAYFEGLDDDQLIPAMVDIVDYMLQHNPENSQMWIQSHPVAVIQERGSYIEENRQQVVSQLLALFKNAPGIQLPSLIANLRLQDAAQPIALSELRAGNMDFAQPYFFTPALSEEDVEFLCGLTLGTPDWVEQMALLRILNHAEAVPQPFAQQLFNDRSRSVHVRKQVLEILLQGGHADSSFARDVALDPTEDQVFISSTAAKYLLAQAPFPKELYLHFLKSAKLKNDALNALNARLKAVLQRKDAAETAAWKIQIQPFVSIVEDLTEQLDEYKARPAKDLLETINELENIGP